ncbi:nucleoside hydrolase [Orbus mooreae]|uniref:nucleoside hydrolase n=1 Tax=Orbus mooreae TaxID=3074107 RepID=UPI00370DB597
MVKRIIIDCDPGNGIPGANVDDGLAIALAIANSNISLELITTVSGNTPRDVGYSVAKNITNLLNRDIPVAKGAAQALLEPAKPWREHLDNNVKRQGLLHLWSDTQINKAIEPQLSVNAAQAIGDLVCQNPQQISVVAIGPLTNIAHTIQLYPDFAKSVAEIVIMGGVFNVPGYLKDTNFAIDPEAAEIVLSSGAKITLAPYDVTTTTMLTHQDLDKIAQNRDPLSHYIVETTRPWLDFSMQTRHIPGCWIHDVLCVAYLIDPSFITSNSYIVDVALQGDYTRGSSRRWKPDGLRLTVGMPTTSAHTPINVLETVNNQQLLEIIFESLKNYQAG